MDTHAVAKTKPKARKPEDLRIFLSLGLPIFITTLILATVIVSWGPGRGQ